MVPLLTQTPECHSGLAVSSRRMLSVLDGTMLRCEPLAMLDKLQERDLANFRSWEELLFIWNRGAWGIYYIVYRSIRNGFHSDFCLLWLVTARNKLASDMGLLCISWTAVGVEKIWWGRLRRTDSNDGIKAFWVDLDWETLSKYENFKVSSSSILAMLIECLARMTCQFESCLLVYMWVKTRVYLPPVSGGV